MSLLLNAHARRCAAGIVAVALHAGVTLSDARSAGDTTAIVGPASADRVQIDNRAPSKETLDAIVKWLAAEFELPENYAHPHIVFASPLKLMAMRYRSFLPVQQSQMESMGESAFMREVVAIYDDRTNTIHLATAWSGASVSGQSVLVHEMVHHLQKVGQRTYECPAAREKLAYEAQDRWLALHGKSLEEEFDVDMMTLLVSSSCMF